LIEAASTSTAAIAVTENDTMVETTATVVGIEEDATKAAEKEKKKKKAAQAKARREKKKAQVNAKNGTESGKKKKVKAITEKATEEKALVDPVVEPAVEPQIEKVQTKEKNVCCGSNTNHQAFNLKSEFIAGYAHTILRGVGCSGGCAVNQVVPASNKPVWLCPVLNSSGQTQCRFALCNNCFGIANLSSGSSSRKRIRKSLD
jgi:hypothetical protein